MDPQQRVFLEICWECLERAGYAPDQAPGPVGVYGGMYNASYFQRHVSTRPDLIEMVGEFQVMLANEKDYITTRVANKLNLTGPAVSVHTACSTSLVAVAQAFFALRTGQCRMALAGGASITCPPSSGYLYNEGSMLSPDGHTRSFDASAKGTVFSDGATVVLLKRLSDAIADGDTIYAVLRGAAVNNDGGAKASFTAPSVDGQAAVIEAALASAGVEARSISYVETHGTATPMGDPIEVEGLTRAFAAHTADTGFCTIGSLKSNVGHMVTAAGAAGLIKAALAMHSEAIPASLHYEAPNPAIDFDGHALPRERPRCAPWPREATPRRAGVSSFGVGGTNAHVIIEEAPLRRAVRCRERPATAHALRTHAGGAGGGGSAAGRSPRRAPRHLAGRRRPHAARRTQAVRTARLRGRRVRRRGRRRAAHGRLGRARRRRGQRLGAAAGLHVPGPGRAVRRHGPRAACRASRCSAPPSTSACRPSTACSASTCASACSRTMPPRWRRPRSRSPRPSRSNTRWRAS